VRAIVLSVIVFVGLGSLTYAQNQPQQLKGVYAPPGSSALGASSKLPSALSAPTNAPVGGPARVNVPGGDPVQGQTLPDDVTSTPIPDRPGYGVVVVNGHRVIVNIATNRIFQVQN
jgi:hypothetical protein